jgi:DNA (cytosine-5)-methyltransferase 1
VSKAILAVDLFCGAGGTSTGLVRAAERAGRNLKLTAVNHWPLAIETHSRNHPAAIHWCETLDSLPPHKAVPERRLDILVASPECTHHSAARGGMPMNDQSRASAWHIIRWAEMLRPHSILVENVKEWQHWGPIGSNGRPLKSKRGTLFQAWVQALRSLGYKVEYRTLVAADYGDPTTRERFFVIARLGRRPIVWPERTHVPRSMAEQSDMFSQHKPWRAAREIIDWKLKSKSIFSRKKPLADATLERITAGMKKFNPQLLEPFLVILRNHMSAQSVDDPLPTLTAGGNHVGLVEPKAFILEGGPTGKQRRPKSIDDPFPTMLTDKRPYVCQPFVMNLNRAKDEPVSVNDPMRTITATSSDFALVEPRPFVIGQQSGAAPRSTDEPLPTITTDGAISVVEPFLVQVNNSDGGTNGASHASRARSVDDPMATLTSKGGFGVAQPFIVPFFGERDGQEPRTHSVDNPLPTVTGHGAGALVQPFLMTASHGEGTGRRVHSVEDPVPTVTGSNDHAVVQPFLTKFYGTGTAVSVDEPLDTLTTKARFGLVEINGTVYGLDVHFRMLDTHELGGAMGFPADYYFAGNKADCTKQIGNAVPTGLAEALCSVLMD